MCDGLPWGLARPQHRLLHRFGKLYLDESLCGVEVILPFVVDDSDLTVIACDLFSRKCLIDLADIKAHIVAFIVHANYEAFSTVAVHSSRNTLLSLSSLRPIP